MSKVTKRLNIAVTDPAMLTWPEIKKLAEQGHDIVDVMLAGLPEGPLFFLGPTAWRMTDKLKRYLPLAIKEMRRIAYPNSKEADDDSTGSDTDTSDPGEGAQSAPSVHPS